MSLPGKWSEFLHWYCRGNVTSCSDTFQQLAEFFLYLRKELKLTVPAIKSCRSALNRVFVLCGMDIVSDRLICQMISSFMRSTHLEETNHQNGTCLWF